MSNEDLVELIQAGGRDNLPELWEQVERFVYQQAHRRYLLTNGLGGVTVEDLYQSGFIAVVAAADTYDPAAGRSFISWLSLALKKAFAETGGYRSSKQARDPLHFAGSMDAPVSEDGDTLMGDLIADLAAAEDFQNVERQIYLEQLHNALEDALGQLPAQQADTLRRRFYLEQPLKEVADAYGVSAARVRQWQGKGLRELRSPQVGRELRQFVEERTPYYWNWSSKSGERTTEISSLSGKI